MASAGSDASALCFSLQTLSDIKARHDHKSATNHCAFFHANCCLTGLCNGQLGMRIAACMLEAAEIKTLWSLKSCALCSFVVNLMGTVNQTLLRYLGICEPEDVAYCFRGQTSILKIGVTSTLWTCWLGPNINSNGSAYARALKGLWCTIGRSTCLEGTYRVYQGLFGPIWAYLGLFRGGSSPKLAPKPGTATLCKSTPAGLHSLRLTCRSLSLAFGWLGFGALCCGLRLHLWGLGLLRLCLL